MTLNADVTAPANVVLRNGVLDGAATLTIPSGVTFNWIAGGAGGASMTGTGTTVVKSGAALIIGGANGKSLSNRTLNNSGTVNFVDKGVFTVDGNAKFNNLAGATFNLQNDVDFGTSTTAAVNNAGTLTKSSPSGTGNTTLPVPLNNTGLVRVNSGSLTLSRGATSIGTFNLVGGDLISAGSTTTFNAGTTVTGSGILRLTGGTLLVNGNVSLPKYVQSGGTVDGPGTLTFAGSAAWTGGDLVGPGTTAVAAGTTLSIFRSSEKSLVSSHVLNNFGTVTLTGTGPLGLNIGAVLANRAGALFDIQSDVLLGGAGARVVNEGTFQKSAGVGTSLVNHAFANSGTLCVKAGTLSLGGGLTQTAGTTLVAAGATLDARSGVVLLGGVLTGTGLVHGDVTNGATLNPGSPLGTLTVDGKYTQTAAGVLNLEVGGTASTPCSPPRPTRSPPPRRTPARCN